MDSIHFYNRTESGSLQHGTRYGHDLGGEITVTGEIVELAGWPTPTMRQAVGGNGETLEWFVGTDEKGDIVFSPYAG